MGRRTRLIIEATVIILALIISLIPFTLMRPLLVLVNPVQGIASSARADLLDGVEIMKNSIQGTAEVLWDREGIPHVFATSDDAAVYAMGWLEASQRLFQMDLIRRLVEGNLSSLLGEKAFTQDRFVLMLGLPEAIDRTAEYILNNRSFSDLIHYLEIFVEGINDYIEYAISYNLLPPEYKVLGLVPEKWRIKDVVAIEKFFSLMLSYDDSDLVLQKLVSKWGPKILLLMDAINRSKNLPVASCDISKSWGEVVSSSLRENVENVTRAPNPEPITKLFDSFMNSLRSSGVLQYLEASNNWVISGNFTKSGLPIVANDPHLALTAPSLWMLVHISAPNLNVAGVLLPGSPFVIIGRNEHIAWGFTDLLGDFVDYYYYVWNGTKYYYKGNWLEPIKNNITIKVWDPVKRRFKTKFVVVERTVHGPLLEVNGTGYAVKWTGLYVSNELEFIMRLNFAKSVKEALSAQKYFGSPIQNFVVADDRGNFAWSPLGFYPMRTNLPRVAVDNVTIVNYGFLPFNGSRGEGEWSGFLSLGKVPILFDPNLPFIATANTKPWKGSCDFYIGYHYADRFRLKRIEELLYEEISRPKGIDVNDVIKIQLDVTDLSVTTYLKLLIKLIERGGSMLLTSKDINIINDVGMWNGSMYRGLWQPSIALAWIYEFHRELWRYLYGSTSDLAFFRIEYAESLINKYLNGDKEVFDILPKGYLEKLAAGSFKASINILAQYFKTKDHHRWLFGRLHYYSPIHPLGLVLPGFNYPRLPAPGGPYTINVAPPSGLGPDKGIPVEHGPSVRLVSDLGDRALYASLPGGNSGNPFSPYYYNLYLGWSQGRYVVINLTKKADKIEAVSTFWVNR